MGVRPPGVTSVIVIVVAVAAVGAILDRQVLSNRLESWRRGVRRLWLKLNTPGASDLSQDAHKLFCGLFDLIYGKRTFTWRRVWASSASSLVALFVVTLVLGYENTVWFAVEGWLDEFGRPAQLALLAIVVLFASFLNLIPDFFSLAETRWVLQLARGKGAGSIALLLVLDLILTTAIFVSGFLAFVLLTFAVAGDEGELDLAAEMTLVINPEEGLVFFLTTFVTSLFWIFFALTFFLISLPSGWK